MTNTGISDQKRKLMERLLTVILTVFFTGVFMVILSVLFQWLGMRWGKAA